MNISFFLSWQKDSLFIIPLSESSTLNKVQLSVITGWNSTIELIKPTVRSCISCTHVLFWYFWWWGFLIPVCALLQSVSLVFFSSSSLLYSFLQAGRFTTKLQRESPINLVANHALDSSVDLCLCPSVCICSFLFPPHSCSLYLPCHSLLSALLLFFLICFKNVM